MSTALPPKNSLPGGVQVVHLPLDQQPFLAGRRDNIKYRELGLTEATSGRMRAQVMHTVGEQGPNGWHYHDCEIQFLYILKGFIELQFYPDAPIRLHAGDTITIPGGVVHQELGSNDGLEGGAQILEVTLPSAMGTHAAPEPKRP